MGEEREREQQPCRCPYCNGTTRETLPFCQLCGAAIMRCPSCGKVLVQGEDTCSRCGASVERSPRQ
jgi:hypothetical protein